MGASRIGAIADSLLLPTWVEDALARMKKKNQTHERPGSQ